MDKIIIDNKAMGFIEQVNDELKEKKKKYEIRAEFENGFLVDFTEMDNKMVFEKKENEEFTRVRISTISNQDFVIAGKLSKEFEPYDLIFPDELKYLPRYKEKYETVFRTQMKYILVIFYIMNNYKEYEVVTIKTIKNNPQIKKIQKKKGKKNTNEKKVSKVSLINRVIRINEDGEIQANVKQAIKREWHVEEFTRRGHFRTYKNGKKVWVKATKIKTGVSSGLTTDKEYRL